MSENSREARAENRAANKAERKEKLKDFIVEGSTPLHLFSTGVYEVDKKLHGGLPFGRCIGWYGKTSTAKTSSVLRALGEVNNINYDTGEYDLNHDNPCGTLFVDLENSFDPIWAKKLGYDEELPENEVTKVIGGENVGDTVTDAINSDLYSAIAVDSFEGMMPLVILDEGLETNEQGRRAQLLAKCFRKWIPALVKAAARHREHPWRVPALIYLNHANEKMFVTHHEWVIPGGNSQRFYASIEIIMSKIAYKNDTVKEHGVGTIKGITDKNKVTGPRGMVFTYNMALKDLEHLDAGQVDNAASILTDVKAYGLMEALPKGKNKVKAFGQEYRIQKDFKDKLYAEPDFEREVWQKLLEISKK